MPIMQLAISDARPADVLRLVGNGATCTDAAAEIGVDRKTVTRWRQQVEGFGDAYDRAAELSRDESPQGRVALDLLVSAWTPGGLVTTEVATPAGSETELLDQAVGVEDPPASPSEERVVVRPAYVEPDVLDARGKEITVQGRRRVAAEPSPYTTVRPPTREEWLAEMAAMAKDKKQPERVRVTAIAAVTSGLMGGPVRARPSDFEDATVAAAAARGRDPGVPASVWEEAKQRFLGPAPDPEAERSGDVVEFERAPPG
jgi:hypothetical protein